MTRVRAVTAADLPGLVRLCAAHAAYERASFDGHGLADRLAAALFSPAPRLRGVVAEAGGELVGYATWSEEFSTWRGRHYVHLDCLYLEPPWRGRGLGRDLMAHAAAAARRDGTHVEWQTPSWNEGAVRFYERIGARGAAKVRFTWSPPEEGR